jgi:hypothetical protein
MEDQKYYQHKYGGVYLYINTVKNKSDHDEDMILYQHVYPFNKETYVRRKTEFDISNKQISNEQLDELLSKPKEEFQKEIKEKKEKKQKEQKEQQEDEDRKRTHNIFELGYII